MESWFRHLVERGFDLSFLGERVNNPLIQSFHLSTKPEISQATANLVGVKSSLDDSFIQYSEQSNSWYWACRKVSATVFRDPCQVRWMDVYPDFSFLVYNEHPTERQTREDKISSLARMSSKPNYCPNLRAYPPYLSLDHSQHPISQILSPNSGVAERKPVKSELVDIKPTKLESIDTKLIKPEESSFIPTSTNLPLTISIPSFYTPSPMVHRSNASLLQVLPSFSQPPQSSHDIPLGINWDDFFDDINPPGTSTSSVPSARDFTSMPPPSSTFIPSASTVSTFSFSTPPPPLPSTTSVWTSCTRSARSSSRSLFSPVFFSPLPPLPLEGLTERRIQDFIQERCSVPYPRHFVPHILQFSNQPRAGLLPSPAALLPTPLPPFSVFSQPSTSARFPKSSTSTRPKPSTSTRPKPSTSTRPKTSTSTRLFPPLPLGSPPLLPPLPAGSPSLPPSNPNPFAKVTVVGQPVFYEKSPASPISPPIPPTTPPFHSSTRPWGNETSTSTRKRKGNRSDSKSKRKK